MLPSACSEGGCYQVGFTQRCGFVSQYLASPVRDEFLPTFEMKKYRGIRNSGLHRHGKRKGPNRDGGWGLRRLGLPKGMSGRSTTSTHNATGKALRLRQMPACRTRAGGAPAHGPGYVSTISALVPSLAAPGDARSIRRYGSSHRVSRPHPDYCIGELSFVGYTTQGFSPTLPRGSALTGAPALTFR
jgi:hypothetical protein